MSVGDVYQLLVSEKIYQHILKYYGEKSIDVTRSFAGILTVDPDAGKAGKVMGARFLDLTRLAPEQYRELTNINNAARAALADEHAKFQDVLDAVVAHYNFVNRFMTDEFVSSHLGDPTYDRASDPNVDC